MRLGKMALWAAIALVGAASAAVIALSRGETVSSLWFITAALCFAIIGYRFYGAFLAARVLGVDGRRPSPATTLENGRDFVPTNRWVVFGHHFAAIAGPGPLIGPTLAAQFGYLPGTLWILIGAVLGGCVHDMMVLFFSLRRNGRSLGRMARDELGPVVGWAALVGLLVIMVILIAVLGLVVVKALTHSPWGTFTVAATIPAALLVGVYLRRRPHDVGGATLLGVALLLMAVIGGGWVQDSPMAYWFDFSAPELAVMLVAYGFAASTIPVWLLLAPRDYLSSFMKLGTVILLAVAVVITAPPIQMPALTQFIDGSGPIFAGKVFPFVFITIACGAISGFHALVCSGTTPKLLADERDLRFIGYGAMATEMVVAITAMVAATLLQPGVYFAINSPAGVVGATAADAVATISSWGFAVTAEEMRNLAAAMGETTLFARTGGAPSLAVGMASILANITGERFLALWYHFAIMFEALFILTTLDAGSRVGRFMLQDLLGNFSKTLGKTSWYPGVLLTAAIFCAAWGYFLFMGAIDPLGGINSLWPLFGIANQMLGVIALCVCAGILVKSGRARYLWTCLLPLGWMLVVTLSAAWQKLTAADARLGFIAHARQLEAAIESGSVAAMGLSEGVARRLVVNDYINSLLTVFFAVVTLVIVTETARMAARHLLGLSVPPSSEIIPQAT